MESQSPKANIKLHMTVALIMLFDPYNNPVK